MPTVSYKGGPTGFVKVLDDSTLVFPGFDGNGMFYSVGNIEAQHKVGMLFIDFETPHRVRVQGTAELVRHHELMAEYTEAKYLIMIKVTKIWVNCPRYIHKYKKSINQNMSLSLVKSRLFQPGNDWILFRMQLHLKKKRLRKHKGLLILMNMKPK